MPDSHVLAAFVVGAASATAGFFVALRTLGFRRLGRPAVHVSKPHPDWVPGQHQPPPFDPDNRHVIDPATVPEAEIYPLVISAIVPRPIGFAATMAADGSVNLAPFSYFNVLSHNPVIVAFGVSRSALRSGGKKDSFQNIEETKEFTINIMSEWFVEVRDFSGAAAQLLHNSLARIKRGEMQHQPSTTGCCFTNLHCHSTQQGLWCLST
eukprot:GHUV01027528.1.p1 GENE.GHUV01027528.1~~GHUV01027528.1.p1  ORF type:complete len:209 (+),score=40.50 GHUV01027528.1:316-942(+)